MSRTQNEATSDHRAALPRDIGASAVEYALMVALIAIVIFGAVAVVGLNLGGLFNDAATSFESF